MPDDVDASFFGSVSYGTLLEFRKLMYTQTYFEENPLKFIDTDWVDTEALKRFLVKRESKDSEKEHTEPAEISSTTKAVFRTLVEEGKEVLELLSSDDEDVEVLETPLAQEDPGASSDTMAGTHSDHDDSDSDLHAASGDSMKTLQVDTTFKRTVAELNEWDSEVVIWEEETEEALTIARIRLKRLCKDGTLLTIRADMELAQALGAGDHFLPSNEPEFSKIDATTTAEEIIEYFIRVCYIHSKRSQEEVDEFTKWIEELGIKEVSDWWQHKLNNKWVLPSLIESLSKIAPDHWDITDSTTNLNESQHHYTNINAGIKLSLVEAILTARELDRRTAAELKEKLASGVQKSKDTYSRMKRDRIPNLILAAFAAATIQLEHCSNRPMTFVFFNDRMPVVPLNLCQLADQKTHRNSRFTIAVPGLVFFIGTANRRSQLAFWSRLREFLWLYSAFRWKFDARGDLLVVVDETLAENGM
ncbi:hypothetical protein BDZ97DRAFT_1760031 [Flammula alnicola]|nr:hypothetical protein BDZ97DRAFT_1760031 [Flammula alnicola]